MKRKNYGVLAFLPLIVFLALYLGFGLFFYFKGESSPFSFVPREAALIFGIAFALLMGREEFSKKTEDFMKNAATPGVMLQCFIFILAGIFSAVSKAMGGVDAVVNAGMAVLPARFIVPGLFIISSLISTSMGTSFGTVSAVAPIAVGFAELGGFDMTLVLCAVLGGAMFGDNLSFISDTTIAATQGAGCKMKDKFKMNFSIAVPAAAFAVVWQVRLVAERRNGEDHLEKEVPAVTKIPLRRPEKIDYSTFVLTEDLGMKNMEDAK